MSVKLENIAIIDSHVHLWDIGSMRYPWLDSEPLIRKNFLLRDYHSDTKDFRIEKMVFVQGDCLPAQTLAEVDFAIEQASADQRLQAIVAYAPLEKGKQIKGLLDILKTKPLVKGVRKMYDRNPSVCRGSAFLDGISLLPEYQLSFDISIKPGSVKDTIAMIRQCPQTQFILAHLAKPDIKNGGFEQFKKDMETFAMLPNVVAKLSGLITEASRENWTSAQIHPYIAYAITCFGFDRLMFGGDWPVVLLSGSFSSWLETVYEHIQDHHDDEVRKLFYGTAKRVYRL